MRTIYWCRLNIEFTLKSTIGYTYEQAPDEMWRAQQQICCDNRNKDEVH